MPPDLWSYIEPFDASKLPGPKSADPLHRMALEAAVSGADAYRCTRAALRRDGDTLRLGNRFVSLSKFREIGFVAVGRAAISQALAVHHALDRHLTQGYAIAPESTPPEVPFRDRVLPASGPGCAEAPELGAAVVELAQGLGERDLLLVLLSAGALGYLAAPPPGLTASDWSRELEELRASGASGAEVDAIARVEATGPVGGRLGDGVRAEVVTLLVDRGEGASLLGGGPTVPIAAVERTAARSVLERVGAWAKRSAARQAPFLADTSPPASTHRHVDRPVVVADGAEALREASAAVGEKRWLPRLADLWSARPAVEAADRFVDRAEELLNEAEKVMGAADAIGMVAFARLSFDLPEGTEEGPALDAFLARAQERIRRRDMTVAAARTAGAPPGSKRPAGGVVGARETGASAFARALSMRAGITDVGVLATAVIARAKAR